MPTKNNYKLDYSSVSSTDTQYKKTNYFKNDIAKNDIHLFVLSCERYLQITFQNC